MERKRCSKPDEAPTAKRTFYTQDSNNFLSRIETSGSRLIREAILRPCPSSMVSELASSMAESHKSGPSSTITGMSAASTAQLGLPVAHPSSSSQPIMPHSFHSSPPFHEARDSQKQLDSFIAPWDSDNARIDESEGWPTVSRLIYRGASDASLSVKEATPPSLNAKSSAPDYSRQGRDESPVDGAAVVALLSDPSFCVDDMPDFIATEDRRESPFLDSETRSRGTNSQIHFSHVHQKHPLSLIPNILVQSQISQTQSANEPAESTQGRIRDQGSPFRALEDFEELQIGPWVDMLATYHEEVWADALPFAQHARKEADAIQSVDVDLNRHGPALERLSMLVGHIKHGSW
ncbi:MAG: hypothetical protein Q9220_003275 [cf. Caloplaca sp. 1 TL-2023]